MTINGNIFLNQRVVSGKLDDIIESAMTSSFFRDSFKEKKDTNPNSLR